MSIGNKSDETALSKTLYHADNKYLSEQRKYVREMVSALKSLDRDLKSLSQMNDNAKNAVMGFNDEKLDEQQRVHTSSEAAKEYTALAESFSKFLLISGE